VRQPATRAPDPPATPGSSPAPDPQATPGSGPAPDAPATPGPDPAVGGGGQAGFRIDPGVRRLDGGRVLLGGSPLRLLRLTPGGTRLIDDIAAGRRVRPGPAAAAVLQRLVDDGVLHPVPGEATLHAGDVTVVIPVRDRPSGLAHTLDALGPVARVIVVDDGSADADSHRRVAAVRGAEVLRRPVSGGPGAARNAGLALAATPVVAFVDAGCRPGPGWLDILLPHLGDPSVVLVAPRVGGDQVRQAARSALARYESAHSALDLGSDEGPIRPRTRIPFVPAATLVVRTSAAREVGGFDAGMQVGEDVDFVWRLVEAGHRTRYEPAARVAHDDRNRVWPWAKRRFDYGTSAAELARRHPGDLSPLGISGWSAAVWGLVASGHPGAAAAIGTGTAVALTRRLDRLEHPIREAARLTAVGHVGAGRVLGHALIRPWFPLTLLAALVSRRARWVLGAAVVIPPLIEWQDVRPRLDPVRWIGLRLADDVAYSAGVWAGCARARQWGPVLPSFRNWPGRRVPDPG